MNTNALTIVPPAIAKVEPKPTKAEIVEALAQRKHAQQNAARQKAKDALDAAGSALNAAILKHITEALRRGEEFTDVCVDSSTNWHRKGQPPALIDISVRFRTGAVPPEIQKLFVKMERMREELQALPFFQLSEIRRAIRDQVASNPTRPNRWAKFLADPAMSRAIDKMLKNLEREQEAHQP